MMPKPCLIWMLVLAGLCGMPALAAAADAPAEVSYLRDIRPVMRRYCWGCHSGGDPKGGLDVSTVSTMKQGGESGPLFVIGKPAESLILEMTAGAEPSMPPKAPHLSAQHLALITAWIASGAVDDATAVAEATQIKVPDVYRRAPAVTSLAFHPSGNLLAAACRSEVVLMPLPSDSDQPAVPQAAPPATSAQGEQAGDLDRASFVRLPTACGLLTHVEFSPDGKTLSASGGSPSQFGLLTLFDPEKKQKRSERRLGFDTLFRGNFSPDGSSIAVGSTDGGVYVVPMDEKAEVQHYDLHSDWVMDVAYSPDGKYLVTGGRDKATKVSSAETGELLRSVDSTDEMVNAVAASDAFAVSAGRSRLMAAYQFEVALSGIQLNGQGGNGAKPVNKRPQYTKNFETPAGEVLDLATSGDRKLLASAGSGPDIRVYEIATQKRVALIKAPGTVFSLALDATGSRLAVGCQDGQVHLYQLPDGTALQSVVPVPVAE